MNKINEFINSGLYETLLKAVQKRNVEIDNIVPFSLLDYDRERLVAARIEIEDLKALLSTNMEEATSFVRSKMQLDFDEEDEYPVGEEVIDDEKPRTINELPYYKNFLVAFLIEYYLVLPYKPNISLIHSILYYKLFAYICKFLYLYNIILADIYA